MRRNLNRSYANFFRERLEQVSKILQNRPQVGIFHSAATEKSQIKNLVTIYNLNLKLLKIFDASENRNYL